MARTKKDDLPVGEKKLSKKEKKKTKGGLSLSLKGSGGTAPEYGSYSGGSKTGIRSLTSMPRP